jgi:hypothetical protein
MQISVVRFTEHWPSFADFPINCGVGRSVKQIASFARTKFYTPLFQAPSPLFTVLWGPCTYNVGGYRKFINLTVRHVFEHVNPAGTLGSMSKRTLSLWLENIELLLVGHLGPAMFVPTDEPKESVAGNTSPHQRVRLSVRNTWWRLLECTTLAGQEFLISDNQKQLFTLLRDLSFLYSAMQSPQPRPLSNDVLLSIIRGSWMTIRYAAIRVNVVSANGLVLGVNGKRETCRAVQRP